MKVGIVSSSVPFIDGGYRNIVRWLTAKLVAAGHEVEEIYLPFVDDSKDLFPQLAAFRMIDLTDQADVIICFRPPAHLVKHPRKVVWFIHHIRIYYDLWDTSFRPFPDTAAWRAIRASLVDIDSRALAEASRLFAISETIATRLRKFNGLESEVMFPPLLEPEKYPDAGTGDEIVYVSRLEDHKRQHLLIGALHHSSTPVKVRLLGASGHSSYGSELLELARDPALKGRIFLKDGWVTEEEKQRRLGGALAVAYLPQDEDSIGYPTLEGAAASKAILTASDSGGTTEFVQDGVNGLVVEPAPAAIGAALDRLYSDRKATRMMGAAANRRVEELGVSWDSVLERLLS